MFDPTQLDQVNDVVQRAGFSDKRKRNEAIRSGMENPGAFQEQNQGYVQEAQQPSEFMGAGRHLAANQNVDSSIASLFQGNLAKHGNDWYYYGDNDYSNVSLGAGNRKTQDIGQGKYNIFGDNGETLGTGYYAPGKAWNQIWDSTHSPTYQEQARNSESGDLLFDDAGNPIMNTVQAYRPQNSGGGTLEDWEILGQLLNGSSPSGYGAWNDVSRGGLNRFYTTNGVNENISGLNTLYGSTPLIYNNKLLGYTMDLNPNDAYGDWGFKGDDKMGLSRIDNNGSTRSASQIWRELNNPEGWAQHGKNLGNGNFFVSPDEASNLPGWTNKESNKYHYESSSGGLGGLGKIFGGFGGALLSIAFPELAPFIAGLNAVNSFASGNPLGGLASLFGVFSGLSGSDMAGAAGVDQAVSGGFSGADLADFTTPTSIMKSAFGTMDPALFSGGLGALQSAVAGGNPLAGAAGGALGSVINSGLGSMFQSNIGDALSKMVGGAANTGIQSLFNQNQAIHGSEQAGRSGGLNAMLNTTSPTQDTYQRTPEEQQQLQRKAIQLAQLRQRGFA